MARFEINGKEYELKLTYASVKHLNGMFENGQTELIGKAMAGDFETFLHVVHAGLFHTGENISFGDVEKAIEQGVDNGKYDLDYIYKTLNEVVSESFFYRKMTEKLLKASPKEATKALEMILAE